METENPSTNNPQDFPHIANHLELELIKDVLPFITLLAVDKKVIYILLNDPTEPYRLALESLGKLKQLFAYSAYYTVPSKC